MSLKERQERLKPNTDGVKKISDVSVCLVRVHACVVVVVVVCVFNSIYVCTLCQSLRRTPAPPRPAKVGLLKTCSIYTVHDTRYLPFSTDAPRKMVTRSCLLFYLRIPPAQYSESIGGS